MKPALIIFVKNPELGKVKTRLAKGIGDKKALEVYKQLLYHTQYITKNLEATKYLYYSSFIDKDDHWENSNYIKCIQKGEDLGTKMSRAFEKTFLVQHSPVCIIGSDCFDLTEDLLIDAFNKLHEYDYVIGPAKDGGFYLLGMNEFSPVLFKNKKYSTDSVYEELISEITNLNRSYFTLPELTDIDTKEDLKNNNLFSKN